MYRIAGFVCEVLICANYAKCYRLAEINSMDVNSEINSMDVYSYTFVLTQCRAQCQILFTRVTVQTVYSTAYLGVFTSSYFKGVDISALLPDPKGEPKGPLSDHLPTAPTAEANKEVLKAVAEAKEPQKKGPYIKFTPKYKAKVAKFVSINGNSYV